MKILLGGIPLGCDNVGDEAILATVVTMMRKNFPNVAITVCTGDPEETRRRLNVDCAPLYGFEKGLDLNEFGELAAKHDFYCWCGATGLSDYPSAALGLLDAAQRRNVPIFIWGVGMDSTFNPAFFTIRGNKRKLLDLMSVLTLRMFDFVAKGEAILVKNIRSRLRNALEKVSLVVLRDPESGATLEKTGFSNFIIGSDTAITLKSSEVSPIKREPGIKKIGFCISAQRKIGDSIAITELWHRLQNKGYHIVFIPMNPITDRKLMGDLSRELEQSKIEWVESALPEDVQAAAGACDALVSSRLHLLILGSNESVPLVGIERGSKISNYLTNFGLTPAGTVDNCDFAKIESEIDRFCSSDGDIFRIKAREIHEKLVKRMEEAETVLVRKIHEVTGK